MHDQLPYPDPAAPYTGWGREHLESLADRTLLALRRWATPGHARFDLPGPSSGAGPLSDGLEAFARSFLAAGFRLSGSTSDPHDHAGWYAAGLRAGTDPAAAERWPLLADVGQARVEAAAISIALHESRAWIWDRLDSASQQHIIDWLAPSAELPYPNNNWRWFCNVTQAFLRSVDGPHDQSRVDENIAVMDEWYLGEVNGRGGWYRDGPTGAIDWYNGWVMQLFSLWYCRMSANQPGVNELQDRFRARLSDYLSTLPDLWGADGAPLFQGRSLIYRYACVGAPWAGAIFDASPLPAGQLRRLALGGVRYFVDRGAFDDDGLLSMGWLDRYEPMRQSYSGPGSPYWSSLGLAGLVLGAEDPFWSAPEEPLPIDTGDVLTTIPQAGWLVSGTAADGIVRIVNHGVDHPGDHQNPFYSRLAYSTATAPAIDDIPVPDNQVVLVDVDGTATERSGFRTLGVSADGGGSSAGSTWGPISCWSAIRNGIEVRAVRLSSAPEHSRLLISGYAVPQQPRPGARSGMISEVRSLLGDGKPASTAHPTANPFGSELLINQIEYTALHVDQWYVAGISLCDAGQQAAEVDRSQWPTLSVDPDDIVSISWPDGVTQQLRP
ncbi:MAG TPA: DUF2264 domain-containing protein [Microlunatus sp.]